MLFDFGKATNEGSQVPLAWWQLMAAGPAVRDGRLLLSTNGNAIKPASQIKRKPAFEPFLMMPLFMPFPASPPHRLPSSTPTAGDFAPAEFPGFERAAPPSSSGAQPPAPSLGQPCPLFYPSLRSDWLRGQRFRATTTAELSGAAEAPVTSAP